MFIMKTSLNNYTFLPVINQEKYFFLYIRNLKYMYKLFINLLNSLSIVRILIQEAYVTYLYKQFLWISTDGKIETCIEFKRIIFYKEFKCTTSTACAIKIAKGYCLPFFHCKLMKKGRSLQDKQTRLH